MRIFVSGTDFRKMTAPPVRSVILVLALFCFMLPAYGQKIIAGHIRDQHSAEPVPFASVQFKRSGAGRQADSSGGFVLFLRTSTKDTLEITSVGYQDFAISIDASAIQGDTLHMMVELVPGKFTAEVV